AAAITARRLDLSDRLLGAEVLLSRVVLVAMVGMTVATIVWWRVMAAGAPQFLGGPARVATVTATLLIADLIGVVGAARGSRAALAPVWGWPRFPAGATLGLPLHRIVLVGSGWSPPRLRRDTCRRSRNEVPRVWCRAVRGSLGRRRPSGTRVTGMSAVRRWRREAFAVSFGRGVRCFAVLPVGGGPRVQRASRAAYSVNASRLTSASRRPCALAMLSSAARTSGGSRTVRLGVRTVTSLTEGRPRQRACVRTRSENASASASVRWVPSAR